MVVWTVWQLQYSPTSWETLRKHITEPLEQVATPDCIMIYDDDDKLQHRRLDAAQLPGGMQGLRRWMRRLEWTLSRLEGIWRVRREQGLIRSSEDHCSKYLGRPKHNRRLFQKQSIFWKKCTFSGRVYKSVGQIMICTLKKYIFEKVHSFENIIFSMYKSWFDHIFVHFSQKSALLPEKWIVFGTAFCLGHPRNFEKWTFNVRYQTPSSFPGVHGHLLQEELPLRRRVQWPERVLREVGWNGILHQRQVEKVHAAQVQEDLQKMLAGFMWSGKSLNQNTHRGGFDYMHRFGNWQHCIVSLICVHGR